MTYFGLHSLQHRGQGGAGILSNDPGSTKTVIVIWGLLSEVFEIPANLDKLTGTGAIGHVRYATAGEASVDNIQPFLFRFHDNPVWIGSQWEFDQCQSPSNKSWKKKERSLAQPLIQKFWPT